MADLRTDYKDDLLDTSVNTQRKYRMVTNDDGTVSFEDATVYTQNGDTFGASDINAVTQNLTAENGTSFNFAYNEETNEYGYMAKVEGADTFFPFSNAKKLYEALQYSGLVTEDMTFDEMCEVLAEAYPEVVNLLKLKFTASGGGSVDTNTETSLVLRYKGTSEGTTNKFTSENFKVSASAKNLVLNLTATRNGSQDIYQHSLILYNVTNGTSQTIYSIPEGAYTINTIFDISAHAGCTCYLQWTQGGYPHNYVCVDAIKLEIV